MTPPTGPSFVPEAMRRRRDQLQELLRCPEAADRSRVREEIIRLVREAERAVEELTEFKESLRPLVERYRAAYPAPPPAPPAVPAGAVAPASRRVDHLGGSTYLEKAWSALAGGEYDSAAEAAERALELVPGDAYGEVLLAWALASTGDLPVAHRLLADVLERQPDHRLALTCLGLVRILLGDLEGADEPLRLAAMEGGERRAVLYATLFQGVALAGRGRHAEARAAFRRALDRGPGLVEAHWRLGWSHYAEGDLRRAAEAWRQGAGAGRFAAWGERCARALESLRSGEPVYLD